MKNAIDKVKKKVKQAWDWVKSKFKRDRLSKEEQERLVAMMMGDLDERMGYSI